MIAQTGCIDVAAATSHCHSLLSEQWSDRSRGQTASPCKISCRSVIPLPRYGNFSISQDGGCRHLGFSKVWIFNGRNAQEGKTASLYQISWRSVPQLLRDGDFPIFPRCAKFGWNRCSSFYNIHVFDFASLAWKCRFTPSKLFLRD